ncbi:MAG: PAS domain S-box protein [Deltaproteobacteria bacterium]|nr:PAS domain S-box protein [Deltaproteobacteria bacterium]MBW1793604.1 PAS domain S-box protein [Deltaproteobacteria bacterium]MBW2329984.1 PAS domain S-box protein [Deltaproteobacteria bacterium]
MQKKPTYEELEQRVKELEKEALRRKKTEETLEELHRYTRELIEVSLDPLVMISSEGKITDVNHATELVTGYPRDKLIGTRFSVYFTEPRKARQGYLDVLRHGHVRDYPLEIRHRDGKVTPILYNASVYCDAKGGVAGVFAAARDITRRREAEERLRKNEKKLKAMLAELTAKSEELDSFVYRVSHDLKSPIVTIEGFVGALKEDFGDVLLKDGEKYLRYISDAARKMELLINDLLDLSRIERVTRKKREFPFARLVEDVLKALQPQIKAQGIVVEIQGDLPVIYGERRRLGRVVDNLLTNAIKYIGKENPSPRIDVGVEEQDGQKAFFVRDNGIGIDERDFDKIFQVFQRLPSAKKQIGEGTGVGLTIVKRIIEHHGGKIWLISEPGKGSTFYFTLKDKEA